MWNKCKRCWISKLHTWKVAALLICPLVTFIEASFNDVNYGIWSPAYAVLNIAHIVYRKYFLFETIISEKCSRSSELRIQFYKTLPLFKLFDLGKRDLCFKADLCQVKATLWLQVFGISTSINWIQHAEWSTIVEFVIHNIWRARTITYWKLNLSGTILTRWAMHAAGLPLQSH